MSGHPIRLFADEERNGRDSGRNHAPLARSDCLYRFAVGANCSRRRRIPSTAVARVQRRRMRGQPSPSHNSREAKLIDVGRLVIRNPPRQHETLPCVRGNFKSLQLANDLERAMLAAHLRAGGDMLPAQQPVHELRRRHGLDLFAERGDG